jgi:hypothetical protein
VRTPAFCFSAAFVLASASLALLSDRPSPGPAGSGYGPISEEDVRAWAARTDWSLPPQPGEWVEWGGSSWQVVEGGPELLGWRSGPQKLSVIPAAEARLSPPARTLPSGEVVRYRIHAVRED